MSTQIFLAPQLSLSGNYAVNGRWAFIPLGDQDALRDATGHQRLFGNYGADYDITVTLTNPTAQAGTVGLYFAPGAGPAAAVFQVDGGPIQEYDPLGPPDERELARETLAPGETRVVHLRTIPLNGSAYPVQVVARPADQAASLPPVAEARSTAVGATGKAGH